MESVKRRFLQFAQPLPTLYAALWRPGSSICRLRRRRCSAPFRKSKQTACRNQGVKGGRSRPMANIELLQPKTIEEAVSLLSQHRDDCKIIAVGTGMVIMLRNRLIAPAVLLSLGRLTSLSYIQHEPGVGLRIGALTP